MLAGQLGKNEVAISRWVSIEPTFNGNSTENLQAFGFDNIESNWLQYNKTIPEYKLEFDSITTNFNFTTTEHTDETKLGDNSMKIIETIKNNHEISIAQLALQLSISTTAVENQLAKLKKKGILLRHGTKGGYWEINE